MTIFDKLTDIANHPRFPTPPAIFLKVLDSVSNPQCTLAEITSLIHHDPGLTTKLLQTVNSALFSLPRKTASIEGALKFVGLKAMRAMVLGLVLPGLQRPQPVDRLTQEFWIHSVTGAVLAREVAKRLRRADAEDFMLAGLLRDLGAMVLDQLFPHDYPVFLRQYPQALALSPTHLEQQRFEVHHAQVSAFLLRRWRIPEELCRAIETHHDPEVAERFSSDPHAWILYFAARAAQMLHNPSLAALNQEVLTMVQERLDMTPEALGEFLAPLEQKVGELAALMKVDIGRQQNYQLAVSRALECLAQLSVENSLETALVSQEKQDLVHEADRWRLAAGTAQQGAMRDSLTQLYNRGFFEEALHLAYHQGRRLGKILGLLFLDLDGFKELNDRFGHAFGDEALKQVAAVLRANLRASDLVARLGGDEFCVLVHNILPDDLHRLALTLWRTINDHTIRHDGLEGKVGVSIGAVAGKPWEHGQSAAAFLAHADQAMYKVKKAAKNQVHLVSLVQPEDCQRETAIRRRLFTTFLIHHHHLAPEKLQSLADDNSRPRTLLGRVARRLGWLSRADLTTLLRLRRQTRRAFVDLAVSGGFLSADQALLLLAIQRENPEKLTKSLVQDRALNDQAGRSVVQEYYQTAGRLPNEAASLSGPRSLLAGVPSVN